MSTRGEPDVARQRALLEQMLDTVREQRRHLIQGNAAGLAETSKLLEGLLARQRTLTNGRAARPDSSPPPSELQDLTRLLQAEGHMNYLLACRGMQHVEMALVAAAGGQQDVGPDAGDAPESPRILDSRS